MEGRKFGRLTALYAEPEAGRDAWLCECDCGNSAHVDAGNLRRGTTRSCGCLKREAKGLEVRLRAARRRGQARAA